MRVGPSAFALAAIVALAGCFGGGGGGGKDDSTPDGAPSTATGTGGTAAGNGTGPSLDVPRWTVGQSWRWTVTAAALQQDQTVTTTVLAADGGAYDVGVALFAQGAATYPLHLVPLGAIDAATLAWQAHGLPVNLLRFPLLDGDTFTTDLWGAAGAQVAVEAVEVTGPAGVEPGYRSTASYAEGGTFLQADYAPSIGQFVRVASYFGQDEPFAEATLDGEGEAPAAPIAFRVTDLARYTASGADPTSLAPKPLTVPADAEMALLACFLPGAPGAFGAELNVPGTPSACFGMASGQREYNWAYGTAMAGPGTITAMAGGTDAATIEAFAIDTTV